MRLTATVGKVALALSVFAGCGGPAMSSVKGKVELDGKPLENATVQFIPQDAGGKAALGTTNAQGVFNLSTTDPGDGAYHGKYKVVVQPPAPTVTGAAASTPGEAQSRPAAAPAAPTINLPPEYSDPGQTKLEQTVPPVGEVVFKLKSR